MTVENRNQPSLYARRLLEASDPEVRKNVQDLIVQNTKSPWLAGAAAALRRRAGRGLTSSAKLAAEAVEEGPLVAGVASASASGSMMDETIVFAVGTPVFAVANGEIDLNSARVEAVAWRNFLKSRTARLVQPIFSIGRIDVDNFDGNTTYLGTAWVIEDGLVATNRHVARYFAEASGAGFKFRLGFDNRNPISARVDFLEELGNTAIAEVPVERIIWVAPEEGPDVAFMKLAASTTVVGRKPLKRGSGLPTARMPVAVIGYPMNDTRFPDRALAEKIFGGIFDKKRVAVGRILGADDQVVRHGCSTLGGNSGSPVIDLETGEAVALHYRGVAFVENDAIPMHVVERCLELVQTLVGSEVVPLPQIESKSEVSIARTAEGISLTIPLRVTISLGVPQTPATAGGAPTAPAATTVAPEPSRPSGDDRARVAEAVQKARAMLANRKDVVAVKAGYRFQNGAFTRQRAVVISVRNKIDETGLASQGILPLPKSIEGVPVDVTIASVRDLVGGLDSGEEAGKTSWHTSYAPRPDLELKRETLPSKFVIHSSPDCGWPELHAFLEPTTDRLSIAMYEFGAQHIVEAVLKAVAAPKEAVNLILQLGGSVGQGTKKDDYEDEETVEMLRAKKRKKLRYAPARVGKSGIFDSAYHIKVAVRDGKALWLSSGSWQSSNQPNLSPLDGVDSRPAALTKYNREWHAILENDTLAALFEEHIIRDIKDAEAVPEAVAAELEPLVFVPTGFIRELEAQVRPRYFEPLRGERDIDVHPVLTPDNYIATVLPFIEGARSRIFFQNQSFNTKTIGGDYGKLLDALLARQNAGLDVRIIVRSFGPDDRDTITNAVDYGFDPDRLRLQKNCHNKGIVVDGDRVLIGSHNWTTAGTGFNRDASLIFFDSEIATFYETLFLYDWQRIGPAHLDEATPAPVIPRSRADEVPPGYEAVPLSMLLGK